MSISESLKPWLGRKSVRGVLVIIVLAILFVIFNNTEPEAIEPGPENNTVVRTTTATNYSDGQSLSLLGNVRAFTEARVTSERAGRVVSVNTTLGEQIQAGTIIASLENASERASVLQAEGVYDAALAAAAQNNVGVGEADNVLRNAQDTAISTLKQSYNTTNGIILNTIDGLFSNPNANVPGLKIDGRGFTKELNSQRVSFQSTLPIWQTKVNTVSNESDLVSELNYASEVVQDTIDMIDTFIFIFNQQDSSSRYTDAELQNFSNTYTGLRSTLIGLQSNINAAESGLIAAADSVTRAQLAATGGVTSSADAQVKQALGSLRAAQANLSKTILRSPISGTVNSLSVRTGDFINSFTQVAIVANNSALEVVTFVSDDELNLISEGDDVLIENEFVGVITQIAPAVDTATRKTEVRIATDNAGISNGDTVRITKEINLAEVVDATIQVPLTAVKFERDNGFIFLIEENTLVATPVILGQVLGNSVEITEGINAADEFVVDARGLVEGEVVEVQN